MSRTSTTQELKRAVRDLRTRLKLTQTEFGGRLGKGLATIQRYENLVPPKGRVLGRLRHLAQVHNHLDLAELFDEALSEAYGTKTDAVALTPLALLIGRAAQAASLARSHNDPRAVEEELRLADAALEQAMEWSGALPPIDESDNDDKVRAAVRELRTRLQSTQTEFGKSLGKGLATIKRYESLVAPKGGVLGQLGELAVQHNHMDLYEIFAAALAKHIGGLNDLLELTQIRLMLGRAREAILKAQGRTDALERGKDIDQAVAELQAASDAIGGLVPDPEFISLREKS